MVGKLMTRHVQYRADGFIDLFPLIGEYPSDTFETGNVRIIGTAVSVDISLE